MFVVFFIVIFCFLNQPQISGCLFTFDCGKMINDSVDIAKEAKRSHIICTSLASHIINTFHSFLSQMVSPLNLNFLSSSDSC